MIFDDTIAKKAKPSLQAKHAIKATGFYQSHLKGKQVWGHQLYCHDAILRQCGITLLY